jgi:hypothetical protein
VLNEIRQAFEQGRVRWRRHAQERMLERGILREHVAAVVANGQIVETYASDRPFPACLIYSEPQGRAIHTVIAYEEASETAFVITAYEPDEQHFESDLRTRKERPR